VCRFSKVFYLYIAKILGHLFSRMCFQLDGMDLLKKGRMYTRALTFENVCPG
jgi:hypothetical protein